MDFFVKKNHQTKLENFHQLLKHLAKSKNDWKRDASPVPGVPTIYEMISPVVESFISEPNVWDRCLFNINHIGDQFIQHIEIYNSDQSADSSFERILCYIYRFLLELNLLQGVGRLNPDLESARNTIEEYIGYLSKEAQSQIAYGSVAMSASILSYYLNHENINDIREIDTKIARYNKKQEDLEKYLNEKIETVENLRLKLEGYENGFNFVSLFDAFDKLGKNVINEKRIAFSWLIIMGVVILIPLVAKFSILLLGKKPETPLQPQNLIILTLSLLSVEIVLIYYFRIVLKSYQSAKTKLLQIELRKSLCQFIQSYSKHSKELKENNGSTLERFESIIFSNIVDSSEQIPSTFDGLEHIATMVKSFQK